MRFNALLVVVAAGFVTALQVVSVSNDIVGAIGGGLWLKIVICHYLF